jgi:recombination protein RecR
MADAIQELTELLARLPEIGSRTAQRLTFHLLHANEAYLERLGKAIASICDRVHECSQCRNLTETDPCPICSDAKRNERLVCVVSSVPDLWAIEATGSYHGQYHVLHGLLSPLDGVGPDELHVDLLRKRIETTEIEEVIIATPPSMDGEVTTTLILQTLDGLAVKLSRIASGVPHGGELEYTDKVTLGRALEGRREIT